VAGPVREVVVDTVDDKRRPTNTRRHEKAQG
jgi:hypothetical protein